MSEKYYWHVANSDTGESKEHSYTLVWVILFICLWDLSRKEEFGSYEEMVASHTPEKGQ